ncbi:MAG: calcium-binding protein [Tepidisphaeraceae bacterium]
MKPHTGLLSHDYLDVLEPRRLLAGDLSFDIADLRTPYAYINEARGSQIEVRISFGKSGNPYYFGFTAGVALTKDDVYGNADDIDLGTFFSGDAIDVVEISIPRGVASGKYAIAILLDPTDHEDELDEGNNLGFVQQALTIISKSVTTNVVTGTPGDDVILVDKYFDDTFLTIAGQTRRLVGSSLFIDAGSGNDKIVTGAGVTEPVAITGAGGNDTIQGGAGDDELSGANGKDKVFGGGGNDYLLGGARNDFLKGDWGNDTMSGAGGNDHLEDRSGVDHLLGGAGNDTLHCYDGSPSYDPDTVSGGPGSDKAEIDLAGGVSHPVDFTTSIEELLR